MANINKRVEVALIDEYQLISDPSRGWAWTRALLGLPASVLHLTGDTSRVELIRHLCDLVGDELEIKEYTRLSPLIAERHTIKSLDQVCEGDAVITFSRKSVYELKKQIERFKGIKCCVVYGSLPPESRSEQARLFNDVNSDHKILVGTDCIGLGLNLNIRRVVFSECQKFNGSEHRDLTPSEIRQIAGRAGRYKSVFPEGLVTSFYKSDLRLIRRALDFRNKEPQTVHKATVFPNYEQLSMFSDMMGPDIPYSVILDMFVSKAKVELRFEMADYTDMFEQASKIDHLPLDLKDRYIFCMAPADPKNQRVLDHFCTFIQNFALHTKAPFQIRPSRTGLSTHMLNLEIDYKIAELYLWLAQRYEQFYQQEKAEKCIESITDEISRILRAQNQSISKWSLSKKRINRLFYEY